MLATSKVYNTSPGNIHTYFIHAILLNAEFPSIAMGSFGSCFKLLLFEVLVLLEYVLSQLMNTSKTDNEVVSFPKKVSEENFKKMQNKRMIKISS